MKKEPGTVEFGVCRFALSYGERCLLLQMFRRHVEGGGPDFAEAFHDRSEAAEDEAEEVERGGAWKIEQSSVGGHFRQEKCNVRGESTSSSPSYILCYCPSSQCSPIDNRFASVPQTGPAFISQRPSCERSEKMESPRLLFAKKEFLKVFRKKRHESAYNNIR